MQSRIQLHCNKNVASAPTHASLHSTPYCCCCYCYIFVCVFLLFWKIRISVIFASFYLINLKAGRQTKKNSLSPPHQTHITVFIGREGTSKIILINLELILLKIYRLIARPPCRGGSITRAEVTGGPGGGAP